MKLINLNQINGGAKLVTDIASLNTGLTKNQESISAMQKAVFPIDEKIDLSGATTATTTFTLANIPNSQKIELNINGVIYNEDEEFTVDRATKVLTWNFTAANGGFDISKDFATSMMVHYYSGALTSIDSVVTVYRADAVPTTGTYKVGDIVLKLTSQTSKNLGWMCTVAGTPGTWIEIGITDFAHTIYPVETA